MKYVPNTHLQIYENSNYTVCGTKFTQMSTQSYSLTFFTSSSRLIGFVDIELLVVVVAPCDEALGQSSVKHVNIAITSIQPKKYNTFCDILFQLFIVQKKDIWRRTVIGSDFTTLEIKWFYIKETAD